MRVLIAGGGVAGLEAALGLTELGAGKVDVTLLAPEETFEIRALSVRDAFGSSAPQRHRLADIAADAGFALAQGRLAAVDTAARTVTDDAGGTHGYDALLVAIGARAERALPHAALFGGPQDAEWMHGTLQDMEAGAAKRIAFVVPAGATWSLPVYELALLTAERARSLGLDDVSIMVVTPEDTPLQIFGEEASRAVAGLLAERDIAVLNSTAVGAETRVPALEASGRRLPVDRIVALPVLRGPAIPGLPADEDGFLPVDEHQAVRGADGVWAAGDGTDFPIKQGGIAAQQADVAAEAIAAAAGADVQPKTFQPVLRGVLLTGEAPKWLRAEADGGDPVSAVAEHALWWPPTKVAGPRLAPYLWRREEGEAAVPPPTPSGVQVERPVGDAPAQAPRRRVEIHATEAGHLELLERSA